MKNLFGLQSFLTKSNVARMHPATFALVMSTGIVAIACRLHGLTEISFFLSWVSVFAYIVIWGLFILKAFAFSGHFLSDWSEHARAPGYFTVVAATCILGSQLALIHDNTFLAQFMWWGGVALWGICTYTIFSLITIKKDKPNLGEGINGGWLVAVVATQAVVVTGTVLDTNLAINNDILHFMLICFWLGGGTVYLWIITLIFYRYMFFKMNPTDLMPPYWINMGAMAISTLAGAQLFLISENSPILSPLQPFLLGMTTTFWATATWWIPMLIILGVWRHQKCKIKIQYDSLYWGLVFPLGMYSVCTAKLSASYKLAALMPTSQFFIGVALLAWLLAFLGWTKNTLRISSTLLQQKDTES